MPRGSRVLMAGKLRAMRAGTDARVPTPATVQGPLQDKQIAKQRRKDALEDRKAASE